MQVGLHVKRARPLLGLTKTEICGALSETTLENLFADLELLQAGRQTGSGSPLVAFL